MVAFGRAVHARLAAGERSTNDGVAARQSTIARLAETIIPQTDTPGAIAAGVPAFISLVLSEWCSAKQRDGILTGLEELEGAPSFSDHVRQLDAAAAATTREGHWFGMFKFFTVWGYYTSRVGVTEELNLQLMPGRYDGDAPYAR